MIKAGADLIMITQDGFVAAASILITDRSQAERVAISSQISKAVNDAVRANGTTFGWQPLLYPKATMLLFNVPQSSTTAHQYVFNTITGRPARFTGVDATCWGMKGDTAFFGASDGVVYEFDTGTSDNSAAIEADALQAFSYFGSRGTDKSFKRVEPVFQGATDPTAALDMNTDFQIAAPTGVATPTSTSAGVWGVSKWGIGTWGSPNQIWRGWRAIRGSGRTASLRVRISTTQAETSWLSTNFIFRPGGQY